MGWLRLIPLLLLCSPAYAQVTGSAASNFRGMPNGNAARGEISGQTLQQSYGIGPGTRVLAAMVAWFGSPKHASIGYRSDDPAQVERQLEAMQALGISGATVAWYGARDQDLSGKTAGIVLHQAEHLQNFSVAIRVEDSMLKWFHKDQSPTAGLIEELQFASQNFLNSPAYLRVGGRPVLLFFGFESFSIDWDQVKASVPGHPLFLFRNSKGFSLPGSDGAFAWGVADDFSYLDRFYSAAASHRGEIAIGDLHKGFNDTAASWSKNRIIDQRCGDTFLDTVRYLPHGLPFVQLLTWDDYEEGTELETGIDNCVNITLEPATASGVRWSTSGNENAVDHYEVQTSADGSSFSTVARVRPHDHSYNGPLSGSVRVEAVGKALFLNKYSSVESANAKAESTHP